MSQTPIIYLASEYPAISHTFIYHEICALRALGRSVAAASINPPRNVGIMTLAEQEEAAAAFVLKSLPKGELLRMLAAFCLSKPAAAGRIMARALSKPVRRSAGWAKGVFYGFEALLLSAYAREKKAAHVHVHFANPAATVAWIASAAGLLSYSLSVHGPDVFDNIHQGLLPEKLRSAVFVRCISWYCRSQVLRWLPPGQWDKTAIVRCGIELSRFSPREEPAAPPFAILCVGRLVAAKGQHVLIDALARLKAESRPFFCTFVGGGEERLALEAHAREMGLDETITFAGALGHGEIPACYDRAHVFVLPSFAEGLPVVLMEAMAKGVACVSTQITGIPELVEDGRTGLLTAPGDAAGLAAALRKLMDNPSLRRQLATEGLRAVHERHDIASNAQALARLFDAQVEGGQR